MGKQAAVNVTILEALLEKATSDTDETKSSAAINAFVEYVINEPECVCSAVRLITNKLQSEHVDEVTRIIDLLDACLESKCPALISEIAKFRFLNELIRLVSPKYQASTTPAAVKSRIIQSLVIWATKYRSESKLADAVIMLKYHGVISESYVLEAAAKSSTGIDDSQDYTRKSGLLDDERSRLLQKLLRSTKPSDLESANALIKSMVLENEHREEMDLIRKDKIPEIQSNTQLLIDLLLHLTNESTEEDFELINELRNAVLKLSPTINQLIVHYGKNSPEHPEISEVDELVKNALTLYEGQMAIWKHKPTSVNTRTESNSNPVNDNSPPILLDLYTPDGEPSVSSHNVEMNFSSNNSDDILNLDLESVQPDLLEGIFEPTKNEDLLKTVDIAPDVKKMTATELFQDLDVLGKSFLQTKLTDVSTSKNVIPQPLNNMAQAKVDNVELIATSDSQIVQPIQHDNLEEIGAETSEVNSDHCTDIGSVSLSDIAIPLIDIKIGSNEKIAIFEEEFGINVHLQLTENNPKEDVSVFLILTTSKSAKDITDYLFQPIVPKDHIPLKFVIRYNVNEDMVTEMGEIESIPLRIPGNHA